MTEAQRVAERWFPEISAADRGHISRKALQNLGEQAIQEFARAVAENLKGSKARPDDEVDAYDHGFFDGVQTAAKLLLREAGVEGEATDGKH